MGFVALARPQKGMQWQTLDREGTDLLLVVDTSKSMNADDVRPTRLERTKLAVRDLVERFPGDRIGLVAFAGDAFVESPMTLDHDALLETLACLRYVDHRPRRDGHRPRHRRRVGRAQGGLGRPEGDGVAHRRRGPREQRTRSGQAGRRGGHHHRDRRSRHARRGAGPGEERPGGDGRPRPRRQRRSGSVAPGRSGPAGDRAGRARDLSAARRRRSRPRSPLRRGARSAVAHRARSAREASVCGVVRGSSRAVDLRHRARRAPRMETAVARAHEAVRRVPGT